MDPTLVIFTDHLRWADPLERLRVICHSAVAGSVLVVVRDYQQSVRERVELLRALAVVCASSSQHLAVADRADVGRALAVAALHLPGGGLSPCRLRNDFSYLSRSGHDWDTLSQSQQRCLDAVFVSPVFATLKGRSALGIAGLEERVTQLKREAPSLSCFALGGVTKENAAQCLQAGAAGVGVMSAALAEGADFRGLLAALSIRSD